MTYTSLDVLKYLVRDIRRTLEWTLDSLGDQGISSDDYVELSAIEAMSAEADRLCMPLIEAWNHYSDGREVVTTVEIEHGHVYSMLWNPDPTKDVARVHEGKLLADPGEDNGRYEIHVTPPQSVVVQTFPCELRAVKP